MIYIRPTVIKIITVFCKKIKYKLEQQTQKTHSFGSLVTVQDWLVLEHMPKTIQRSKKHLTAVRRNS